ncbi:MAG TPA: SlyX family protein [Salinisphaeraceae bacterium]|nr:SlyX family protein [Salinisphaeraceae bacterium]
MDEAHITAIETRLSYLEHGHEQLSELVYEQARQIERLTDQCRHLQRQIAGLGHSGPPVPPQAEVPPHY